MPSLACRELSILTSLKSTKVQEPKPLQTSLIKTHADAEIPHFKIGWSSCWLPLRTANIISIYENVPFVPPQLLAMVEMSSPVSRTITACLRLYSSQGEKWKTQPKCRNVMKAVRTSRGAATHLAEMRAELFGARLLPSVAFLLKVRLNLHHIIKVVKRFLKPILSKSRGLTQELHKASLKLSWLSKLFHGHFYCLHETQLKLSWAS